MTADVPSAPARPPRRARYLVPRSAPHRAEVLAAAGVLVVFGGLVLAPVTFALSAAFHATSKLTRWRPLWLAAPLTCGVVWVLAIGAGTALAGFTADPRAMARIIAWTFTDPGRLNLQAGLPGPGSWLAGQVPAGLAVAAGLAAATWWLNWLHTDEWDVPAARPGLISFCRGKLTTAFVRSGGVVTREGACLGVERASGRPAAIAWRDAEHGVLVTGSRWPPVAASGCQLVHAAVRRRKPVIAVDLAGSPGLAPALAEVCAATGAPLQVFGPAGTGYYEPLRGGDPDSRAALLAALIDWGPLPEGARRSCRACLPDLFAVMAAAPGAPGVAVLDEVAGLLRPGALPARARRIPAYHPRREQLAARAQSAANLLEADQRAAGVVTEQLASLRASPLGRWLGPAPADAPAARISLGETVRQRGAALFTLAADGCGPAGARVAGLVACDVAALCSGLSRAGVAGDGLAWFGGCESAGPQVLAGLAETGAAGFASVLATTSPAAAGRLAQQVRVLVLHRVDDPALASQLAPFTGCRLAPPAGAADHHARRALAGNGLAANGLARPGLGGQEPAALPSLVPHPVVAAEDLRGLGGDDFVLATRGPAGTVTALCQPVPARIPGQGSR